MKPYPRVTIGWRVMTRSMVPDKDGKLIEHITPLSRIFHVKGAAFDFYDLSTSQGIECWVQEIKRPERKGMEVT